VPSPPLRPARREQDVGEREYYGDYEIVVQDEVRKGPL
jgi:hypothetical protein